MGGLMPEQRNPLQPLYRDANGVTRFKANKIVRYLLDNGVIDLNHLAALEFSQDDQEQFAQLIGYSLVGFHELSYVSDATAMEASKAASDAGLPDQGCRSSGCGVHCGVKRD